MFLEVYINAIILYVFCGLFVCVFKLNIKFVRIISVVWWL